MVLVDSHCHLNFPVLYDDLDEVIERAKNSDVRFMQTVGTTLEGMPKILEIIEKYSNVYGSVGIHPEYMTSQFDWNYSDILSYAKHDKIIAIGETGLDYSYDNIDRAAQQLAFKEHIRAASEANLPLIIHTRDAEDDTFSILNDSIKQGLNVKGVIHCFTGTKEFAEKMIGIGFYISISGIVTFKNAVNLQEVVKYLPLSSLLIETDSPYLAPMPYRGKSNEPAFVRYVAEHIAKLHDVSLETVADATTGNFFRLFSKAYPPKAL